MFVFYHSGKENATDIPSNAGNENIMLTGRKKKC
jgi:hypothetical protein